MSLCMDMMGGWGGEREQVYDSKERAGVFEKRDTL